MQKPTIGCIVIFKSNDLQMAGGGAEEAPAIITRVWSDTCVNLTVMRDAAYPLPITSVCYAEDHAASGQNFTWRWPSRE